MHLTIRHATTYKFDAPVNYGLQQLRKTPKSTHAQSIVSWSATVEGGQMELSFDDHHNNRVDLISFGRDTTALTVTCVGEVEIGETHGIVGPHLGPSPLWLYERITARTKAGQGVRALLRDLNGEEPLDRLHRLSATIHDAVSYEVGSSNPDWTAEEALAAGRGVCQDHAHVFIAAAREMGLPARYVSGYLMLNERVDQDAMHAWAEAYLDGLGWVGFDPSNGISPDTRYVRVATGLDYADAAPVTGTTIGGQGETLSVDIQVAQQ